MSDEIKTNPLVSFDAGIDLNQALQQGQSVMDFMEKVGIKEATFKTGMYYNHNELTGTSTVAAESVMMQRSQHTTVLVFRNNGSSPEQALPEINNIATQKALGAFSGKSQTWVSEQFHSTPLLDEDK
ncbi:TPA: hypothetical protein MJG03_15290 [Klebsiella pneumoniae]|uniref:hypothetical protein n=1 Tax=Klebsiella pneumoniae complex TaxID=3390273 RepID=UPI0005B30697|nr:MULTISPECIES: hypothetical protein [Klebsiella]MCF0415399.1 hypothetical protein [Klebsiella pneumoniae]MDM8777198.1 hypothetical protein [Klebsiella variicola]VAU33351.1 Uncharacterised protein [Klebsiella variicola]HBZ1469260.1 hypothetical protein [Klebsiella pneumoniae]